MGYDPSEARDYHGRWTDGIPGHVQDSVLKNLLQELSPEEQQLLNKDYANEQEFRQAVEQLINEKKAGNLTGNQVGSGNSGSGRGDNPLSEQEKIRLQESVQGYLNKYGQQYDLPGNTETNVVLDENRSKEIALAYEKMPENDASNPKVKEAYNQLVKEVDSQYDYLTKDVGIKTVFSESDPYSNSKEMVLDVAKNKQLRVYSGGEDHPLLGQVTKDKNGLTANEKFRAVHDYFGHAVEQNQFGKLGEERAWVAHSKMFSPLAQSAMTTETRGQNSWVNFSGANEQSLADLTQGNKLIKAGRIIEGNNLVDKGKKEFKFAIQKVALLPDRFYNWKVYKK